VNGLCTATGALKRKRGFDIAIDARRSQNYYTRLHFQLSVVRGQLSVVSDPSQATIFAACG
jgi:hypothetical protein